MMQMPLFFGASTVRVLCTTDIAKFFSVSRLAPLSLSSIEKMVHDSGDGFIHHSTMRTRLKNRTIEDTVGTKVSFLTEIVCWTTFHGRSHHIKLRFFTISVEIVKLPATTREFEKTLRRVTTISGERYTIGRRKRMKRLKESTMHVQYIKIVFRIFNYCALQCIVFIWISNDQTLQFLLNQEVIWERWSKIIT